MIIMKKKIISVLTAAAVMAACFPAGAAAAGTSSSKATVHFSAGTPSAFEMVDEELTVHGDLAEKYFPNIAANEPSGVSFADVLVAAHIKKYGESKVKNYLDMVPGTANADASGQVADKTQIKKLFGHAGSGIYFINDNACKESVSVKVKNRDHLYAGAGQSGRMNLGYSFFEKNVYSVKAGKKVRVKADYKTVSTDAQGRVSESKGSNLSNMKIEIIKKAGAKVIKTSYTTNANGIASISFREPGVKYISLTGNVNTANGQVALAGAIAKVKVFLGKTKIRKKSSSIKTVTLKWKKVPGAKKYEVFRSMKKNGKFRKIKLASSTKFVNKKLKSGKKYFYKVRAYAKTDGEVTRSEFSKTVGIATKKPAPKVTNPSPSSSGPVSSSSSKSSSSHKSSSSKSSSSSSSRNSAIEKIKKLFNLFR